MESIYFEKQEGSLCAQHCLNALLQGPYFTAVDLAMHAQTLDEEERARMAESGVDTDEYRTFIQQPSGNMDDSGYFSVQVISSCLSVWGLELVRYGSTEEMAQDAQKNPESMKAYICNYRDHWFTVRKLASQWFNLNSLSSGPKLISDTYLGMFLAQLQQEGYSIFIVLGDFPQSEADIVLKNNPVKPTESNSTIPINKSDEKNVGLTDDDATDDANSNEVGETSGPSSYTSTRSIADKNRPDIRPFEGTGYRLGGSPISSLNNEENEELQRAVELSLAGDGNPLDEKGDDTDLRKAIELSLRASSHYASISSEGTSSLSKPSSEADDLDLQRALTLSLESKDSEELRRKRLAYFEKFNTKT